MWMKIRSSSAPSWMNSARHWAISKIESAAQDAAGIANAPLPSSMAARTICELGIGSKQPARSATDSSPPETVNSATRRAPHFEPVVGKGLVFNKVCKSRRVVKTYRLRTTSDVARWLIRQAHKRPCWDWADKMRFSQL